MNTPKLPDVYEFEEFVNKHYDSDFFYVGFDYPNLDRLCPFEFRIREDVLEKMFDDENPEHDIEFAVFAFESEYQRDFTKWFISKAKHLMNMNEGSELPKLKVREEYYSQEVNNLIKIVHDLKKELQEERDKVAVLVTQNRALLDQAGAKTITLPSAINHMHHNCKVSKVIDSRKQA
jgi:hypothetical protein